MVVISVLQRESEGMLGTYFFLIKYVVEVANMCMLFLCAELGRFLSDKRVASYLVFSAT